MQLYKIFTGMGRGYGKQFQCKNYTAFKQASRSQTQEWRGSDSPGNAWLDQGLQQSTESTSLQFCNKLSNEIRGGDNMRWDHMNELRYKDPTIPFDDSWATDSCRVGRLSGMRGGSQAAVGKHCLISGGGDQPASCQAMCISNEWLEGVHSANIWRCR